MTMAANGRGPGEESLAADFRFAMRRQAAMVTIISTEIGGCRFGMTATAVTSLSTDPPSLLACMNRSASMRPHLEIGVPFCINLLADTHTDVSDAFSGGQVPERRFETGAWTRAGHAAPHLSDAVAAIFCSIDQIVEYGSHSILIGKVNRVQLGPAASPLVYCNGRFLTTR